MIQIQLNLPESAFSVLRNGQILEDYPEDKYGSSCLILGLTAMKRPLHIQCSYPTRPLIKIITLYEPDLQKWNDNFSQRRLTKDDN
jgi:hypothetical protein